MLNEDYLKNGERLDDLMYKKMYIIQNPALYTFTSDAVILANLITEKNANGIDFCSGSGVIGILVCKKNNCKMTLVEIQTNLAEMSERSIKLNNLDDSVKVINEPIQNLNSKKMGNGYDFIVCNPPYKKKNTSNKLGKFSSCTYETLITIEEIISKASELLKYSGSFYISLKEERLAELFFILKKYCLEPKELTIRKTKGASIIFVKAKKYGASGIKLKFIEGEDYALCGGDPDR